MTSSIPEKVLAKILERIPLGRLGTPDEVARLARFLIEEGDYIASAVLHLNGGVFGG